ncbi:hypothetical protein PNEG_00599 [Pneumocystis murina B123]|uniref:Uncharacterized protein n=1 Tax=Pneumocystis murina (strain B123) TaxID=1069680 RepID=M7NQJ7_PNEMU|nr:hypothetical protein PNEG_00599 [Pneumocystis murina B123]EMR10998.1 hypothetical protein PNEG_00599 [Pneumocystis murina B123]
MNKDILPKGSKKQIILDETQLYNQLNNKSTLSEDLQTSLLNVGMRIRKAIASGYKTKQTDSPISKSNIDIIHPTYPSKNLSIKHKRRLS